MNSASALESIFFRALKRSTPDQRSAYLDDVCAGDEFLRQQVQRLLDAQAVAGNFLEQPALETNGTTGHPPIAEHSGSVNSNDHCRSVNEG